MSLIENQLFKFLKLDGLLDTVKGYVDSKIQLIKLEAQEKAANAVSMLLILFLLGFMFLLMMVFMSLALGNYLNYLLHSSFLGFGLMGLFFLVMVVILALNVGRGFLFRKINGIAKGLVGIKKEKD